MTTHFERAGRLAIGVATFLLLFGLLPGCAWDAPHWNLDRLRDERAVDIEQRLSRNKPIVENPFPKAD